jgi:tetratricopeptide (TPR) repeat protein
LNNNRQQAIRQQEERLHQHPDDISTAHALAIAYLWGAQDLEKQGAYEQAEVTWQQAIAYWSVVLHHDAYWAAWREDRVACYQQPITQAEIARLGSELGQQLFNTLADYANRYEAEGRLARAKKYRELSLALEVELEGARAIKEVGGLALDDSNQHNLACGLLYVHHMGLEQRLAQQIAHMETMVQTDGDPDEELWQAFTKAFDDDSESRGLSAITPEKLHRLRCTFSQLAGPLILLEGHQPEAVLQALPPEIYQTRMQRGCKQQPKLDDPEHLQSCSECQEFLRTNTGYLFLPHRDARLLRDAVDLAIGACFVLARESLAKDKSDLEKAQHYWKAAIDVSTHIKAHIRTRQGIARMVLSHIGQPSRDRGPETVDRLTEAIQLIESASDLVGGADEGRLRAKTSEMLMYRGIWYGYNEYEPPDYEKSVADLRRALELGPSSVDVRENLCRALIFYAEHLYQIGIIEKSGDHSRSLELAVEALSVLHESPKLSRIQRFLQVLLPPALDLLERLVLPDQDMTDLLARLRDIASDSTHASGADRARRAQEAFERAQSKLDKANLTEEDISDAIIKLIRAMRDNPMDEAIRELLIRTLKRKVYGAG